MALQYSLGLKMKYQRISSRANGFTICGSHNLGNEVDDSYSAGRVLEHLPVRMGMIHGLVHYLGTNYPGTLLTSAFGHHSGTFWGVPWSTFWGEKKPGPCQRPVDDNYTRIVQICKLKPRIGKSGFRSRLQNCAKSVRASMTPNNHRLAVEGRTDLHQISWTCCIKISSIGLDFRAVMSSMHSRQFVGEWPDDCLVPGLGK
ncbi:hypothetical protein DFH27DRAFT_213199 [Peziza echinospora]|nr:hypothetical protein DFH27DRAFT_213199 [Peziza echinospora]